MIQSCASVQKQAKTSPYCALETIANQRALCAAARRPGPPAAEGCAGAPPRAAVGAVVGADRPGGGVPGRRTVRRSRGCARAGVYAGQLLPWACQLGSTMTLTTHCDPLAAQHEPLPTSVNTDPTRVLLHAVLAPNPVSPSPFRPYLGACVHEPAFGVDTAEV